MLAAINSRFYAGEVAHYRFLPKIHSFKYKVFSLCVDLDELDEINRFKGFSVNAFNLLSFHENDYGLGQLGLRQYVNSVLTKRGFSEATSRIELLCYPRILGYVFNPLSIYFCYDQDNNLQVVMYEVSNTFGDRHSYLLNVDTQHEIKQECEKALYVSPFMPMQCYYQFEIKLKNNRVSTLIKLFNFEDEHLLNALFVGEKRNFDEENVKDLFFSYPLMTLKVVIGIHWEALRLWVKKVKLVKREKQRKFSISWKDAQGKMHYESL